jgi:hypothetical protein
MYHHSHDPAVLELLGEFGAEDWQVRTERRLILADALEDAGCNKEAAFCRLNVPINLRGGRIHAGLLPAPDVE